MKLITFVSFKFAYKILEYVVCKSNLQSYLQNTEKYTDISYFNSPDETVQTSTPIAAHFVTLSVDYSGLEFFVDT